MTRRVIASPSAFAVRCSGSSSGGAFRGRRRIVSHSTDRSAAGRSRASSPVASRSGALKIDTRARCRRPVLCWLHRHRRRRVGHRSADGGGRRYRITNYFFPFLPRATRNNNNYYANAKRPTDIIIIIVSHILYMSSL